MQISAYNLLVTDILVAIRPKVFNKIRMSVLSSDWKSAGDVKRSQFDRSLTFFLFFLFSFAIGI